VSHHADKVTPLGGERPEGNETKKNATWKKDEALDKNFGKETMLKRGMGV